jgi:hypothetical protein
MRKLYSRSISLRLSGFIVLVSLLISFTDTSASRGPVRANPGAIVNSVSSASNRYGAAALSFSRQGKAARSPILVEHPRILVTTTAQKVGGPPGGGCSLQEAIYAANFSTNLAPDPANPSGPFIRTECVLEVDKTAPDYSAIVLPSGGVFSMSNIIDDYQNPFGPTATPIIFSNILIEGNGARLQRTGSKNLRAFSVGHARVDVNPPDDSPYTVESTGELTIFNLHVKGFKARGGDGPDGGGGGMGAGGAIYLKDGELTLVNSTFEGNSATGGNSSTNFGRAGGGGGGLSGNGGHAGLINANVQYDGGGGGGGSRGNGANGGGSTDGGFDDFGGGGGGTVGNGQSSSGGSSCGGDGGHGAIINGNDGSDGSCPGGGGGGGQSFGNTSFSFSGGNGGNGSYGGGGGGGGFNNGNGGKGGFGGGGGGAGIVPELSDDGGDGGFGGGGGNAHPSSISGGPGHGGPFGGNASENEGGGGAGLGGAIFNDSGTLLIFNCTFTGNIASGGAGTENGDGQGNTIFSRHGVTGLQHVTVSGNGGGADIVDVAIVADGGPAGFGSFNSILANNLGGAPNGQYFITFNGGQVVQDSSNSGNLIEVNGASGPNTGPFTGVVTMADPQLKPLALNAPGNTPTMAITASSPAFNTADSSNNHCLPTDQRGVSRPQLGGCDIGAYEVGCSSITCPGNKTQSNDPNQCGAIVTYPAPTTNGSCIPTCSPASGSFFPKGTTTVTCSADSVSCAFTVTVNDSQAPAITCPANVTKSNDPNQCGAVVSYPPPTVSDNCPGVGAPSCTPASGSFFPVGTTTVTCSVNDSSNNKGSCGFTVTVKDTQAPSIICPANFNVAAASSCPIATSAPVSFTVTATDNCPGVTIVCRNQNNQVVTSGSSFPVGTTTVTCTATDIAGNTAMCGFSVTVFSFCLQDETNSGNVVLVNAQTGDYSFCCGGVLIATGRGVLTTRACIGSIDQTKGDRRVHIQWDTSANNATGAGTAIVQAGPNKTICQITDKKMAGNSCSCH